MMAAHTNKWPALVITFVLFYQLVSGAVNSSQCTDGVYDFGGLKCCKCGIGLYVQTHCTANLQFGQCEPCSGDTFNSHPTDQTYCESCTSCSHDSTNLEEADKCTSAIDRKCRCKKDHYCISGTSDDCKLCSPCAKCPEGVKETCKGNSDTVCNEKIEVADNTGTIVGSIIAIAILIVGVGAAGYYCKKKQRQIPPSEHPNGNGQGLDVELKEVRPLIEFPKKDLQPYIPDIAELIGWNDMKEIAIRSEIPMTKIDDCKLNNPNNAGEQTIELLSVWVQSQGLTAGEKLYQILESTGKRLKADKVRDILLSDGIKSST